MRNPPRNDDPWGDDRDDWENAEPAEDAIDDESTIDCPYCHEQIHEDAERCPYCEHYLSDEDRQASPKPWWVVLGALLGLATVFFWLLF